MCNEINSADGKRPLVEILAKHNTPNHPYAECVLTVACGPFIFNELQARRDNNGQLRITFPTVRVQVSSNGSRTIAGVFFRKHGQRVFFNNVVLEALAKYEETHNHVYE